MFITLVEVDTSGERYRLRETTINTNATLSITEEQPTQKMINESANMGMSPHASYSRLVMTSTYGGDRFKLVVGSPETIRLKIGNTRKVLKG